MPPRIPMELLRGALALLCVFFAYQLGRAMARARKRERRSRAYPWAIRALVTGAALAWRHPLDAGVLAVWALAGAACAAGVRMGMRPSKPGEDLSREIFPDQ